MVFSLFLFVFLLFKILQKKWGSKQYCLEENLKNCEFFSKKCDFHDDFWSSLNSGISFRYRWNMISACILTLIWHETQQNLSRRTRFETKRHRLRLPFMFYRQGVFAKWINFSYKYTLSFMGVSLRITFFTTLKRLCYLVKPKNSKIWNLC